MELDLQKYMSPVLMIKDLSSEITIRNTMISKINWGVGGGGLPTSPGPENKPLMQNVIYMYYYMYCICNNLQMFSSVLHFEASEIFGSSQKFHILQIKQLMWLKEQ